MTAMMLAETVVAHYRELVDFLSRRTGSRDAAQDCAQETWVKLARSRKLKACLLYTSDAADE